MEVKEPAADAPATEASAGKAKAAKAAKKPAAEKKPKKEKGPAAAVVDADSDADADADADAAEPFIEGKVVYMCGCGCKREVTDDAEAIMCEQSGCEKWFFRKCAGLTPLAYHAMMNTENAVWACDECLPDEPNDPRYM